MTRAATRDRIIRAREHIRRARGILEDIAAAHEISPCDPDLIDVIWDGADITTFLDTHCSEART